MTQEKRAIVTLMIGEDPSFQFALKSFEKYAKRVNADLIIHSEETIKFKFIKYFQFAERAWIQKFLLQEYFAKYDRVLYLDADIIITKDAPDIFETYPKRDTIYMLNEHQFADRSEEFEIIKDCYDFQMKRNQYFNTGVMLFSKECNVLKHVSIFEVRDIFKKTMFLDQTYINYLIEKYDYKAESLTYDFNRMDIINPHSERFNAAFIHYAGGSYCRKSKKRPLIMKSDYEKIFNEHFSFLEALNFKLQCNKGYIKRRIKRLYSKYLV